MNSPKSAKARIFTFPVDPDGNLLTDGRFNYTWNAENRLITITTEDTEDTKKRKLEFMYDHMGRRTIKKVYSWVNDAWQLDKTVTFVYDGYNEIARFEDGPLAKTYIWGEDLSGSLQGAGGVGGLLLVADSTNTYAPVYDANGNVTGYMDASSGAQVADYSYSPFGRTITKSGSKADEFDYKFSTKPEDQETGLYYYIFRMYDPEMGRWVSRDPIEESGGFNLFGFIDNAPVLSFDSTGLSVNPLYNLKKPNVGPCKWLGWEHKMPKEHQTVGNKGRKTAGYTDTRLKPSTYELEFLPSKHTPCTTCCGKKGQKIKIKKFDCEVKIYIDKSFNPNYRASYSKYTIWEHEARHAFYFGQRVAEMNLTLAIVGDWCIPEKCKSPRLDFMQAYFSGLENYESYRDSKLHVLDYPPDETEKWKGWKKFYWKRYMKKMKKAKCKSDELIKCIDEECGQ